jgi:hypothetical protein
LINYYKKLNTVEKLFLLNITANIVAKEISPTYLLKRYEWVDLYNEEELNGAEFAVRLYYTTEEEIADLILLAEEVFGGAIVRAFAEVTE